VTQPLRRRGSLVPISGSLEAYEAGLPSNFRRNLRKAHNRTYREHRVETRFITGEKAGDARLLQQFLDLEGSGWKGQQGTSIRDDEALVRYYRALTGRLADRGWLEWHQLAFDGELVAAHLAVRFGGALVLPKIAYDERFSRISPGNTLFREVLSRAFGNDQIHEVNCLSDMPWHRNWAMPQTNYRDLLLTPRRPLCIAASLRESGEVQAWSRRVAATVPGMVPLLRRSRRRLHR
jgi:CelD/BcsL family acetyltransferase involved in cellulose biosynthesis